MGFFKKIARGVRRVGRKIRPSRKFRRRISRPFRKIKKLRINSFINRNLKSTRKDVRKVRRKLSKFTKPIRKIGYSIISGATGGLIKPDQLAKLDFMNNYLDKKSGVTPIYKEAEVALQKQKEAYEKSQNLSKSNFLDTTVNQHSTGQNSNLMLFALAAAGFLIYKKMK